MNVSLAGMVFPGPGGCPPLPLRGLPNEVVHQFHLDLLYLEHPLSLVEEEVINFFMQLVNLHLGIPVYPVIIFGIKAIPQLQPLLTHDDDRRQDRSNRREDEVEQVVGVRVDRTRHHERRIYHNPQDHQADKHDNKRPSPGIVRNTVREPPPETLLPVKFDIDVLREKRMVFHCSYDSRLQPGEFTFLVLENLSYLLRLETVEISQAYVSAG